MPSYSLLNLGRDNGGLLNNYFCEFPFSTQYVSTTLTADVVQPYVVPPGVDIAYIEYSKAQIADVYVGLNVIPIAPANTGDVLTEDGGDALTEDGGNILLEGSGTAGVGVRLNPLLVTVGAGETLNFVSTATTVILVSFFTRNKLRQF